MAKKEKDKKDDVTGLFIPGGLLVGIGLGFVYGNVPAGTLIGLGAGFIVMAIIKIMSKK
jgi:hypothetical protein